MDKEISCIFPEYRAYRETKSCVLLGLKGCQVSNPGFQLISVDKNSGMDEMVIRHEEFTGTVRFPRSCNPGNRAWRKQFTSIGVFKCNIGVRSQESSRFDVLTMS